MIDRTTETISPDEPCWGVIEQNRLMPMPDGSTQWRRMQIVLVNRGDGLAEYRTDLGNAFLWEAVPEQRLLSLGDDRVGDVLDEAERGRHDDFGNKIKQEIKESSTLIKDFLQEKEENWERIRNRSQFGPAQVKQRNGFPNALRRSRV